MREEEAIPQNDADVASEAAVRSAIAELQHDQTARAKLTFAAETILRRHPRLAHISPGELIAEALLRTLDSRRKWKLNRIGFLGHVDGAMRSIASSATKAVAKGMVTQPLETLDDDGQPLEVVSLELVASAEDVAIANEEREEFEMRLAALHHGLTADSEALAIYERLVEGMPKREIRAALKMSDTEYWTADRRLMRLIDHYFKKDGA